MFTIILGGRMEIYQSLTLPKLSQQNWHIRKMDSISNQNLPFDIVTTIYCRQNYDAFLWFRIYCNWSGWHIVNWLSQKPRLFRSHLEIPLIVSLFFEVPLQIYCKYCVCSYTNLMKLYDTFSFLQKTQWKRNSLLVEFR